MTRFSSRQMVSASSIEKVLDPRFELHAQSQTPVAPKVDQAITAAGLLVVGGGGFRLLRRSDRFGADRPVGLLKVDAGRQAPIRRAADQASIAG